MTGSIKDYSPNFNFIIPEFNIAGWHDYLEENFRSIDALLYNIFAINQYKGKWTQTTSYNINDVLFILDDDSDYNGRLIKVLVTHTTTSDDFDTFFAANPSYYELFLDATAAQTYAQEAKDWAIKTDGTVDGVDYSSKYYAQLITPIATDITTVSGIAANVTTVAEISTEIGTVVSNLTDITTVAGMSPDVSDVVSIKDDIEWIADNDSIVTTVANDSTKISTVSTNISNVNTVASISNDVTNVAGNTTNINTVATDINNVKLVADDITNVNTVASNNSNINTVAGNISDVNTTATNISDINTAASNITVIQNAPTYATNAQNSATLAEDWAIKTNGLVDNTDYSAKYYAQQAAQYSDSLKIGQIITSIAPLNEAGLHLLDGSLLSGGGAYSDFVTYIAGLVSSYPDIFETEANWQNSVTNYGVCGKFVYDNVNNTIRLPKISGFIEGTVDITKLGELAEAGLPNITGKFYHWHAQIDGNGLITGSIGAFSDTDNTSSVYKVQVNGTTTTTIGTEFNASNSNSIYNNSNTVQPQSIKVLYYIVIANSVKTDIQVDIDEIMSDLDTKADKTDLNNKIQEVSVAPVSPVTGVLYVIPES